jgi:hypothetical protein
MTMCIGTDDRHALGGISRAQQRRFAEAKRNGRDFIKPRLAATRRAIEHSALIDQVDEPTVLGESELDWLIAEQEADMATEVVLTYVDNGLGATVDWPFVSAEPDPEAWDDADDSSDEPGSWLPSYDELGIARDFGLHRMGYHARRDETSLDDGADFPVGFHVCTVRGGFLV